jgi:TfoX/Sxy family transcriptional regulator of competence genes
MMAYDLNLAKRIRATLAVREDVVEKQMFGGIAFMIRGHMSCGVIGSTLMVRIDAADQEALLREPGARPMDFTGRPMHGFLYVDALGIATTAALRKWVGRATAYAESKPRKTKKPSSRWKGSRV